MPANTPGADAGTAAKCRCKTAHTKRNTPHDSRFTNTMSKKKFLYARNSPFILDMKPGRYAWCACGGSKKQPFCDGSHSDTGMYPIIEVIKEAKQVKWCGCKSSESKPYCDGSHAKYAQ
jgi:CDGSH-type Zn-finger protein